MSESTVRKLANPTPLGLLGFGVTTVLLNLVNAGAFPLDVVILAMGIAYGGLAQIFAGLMEYKRGNTFGTLVFTSYGLFWWSLVMILVLPGLLGFNAPSANSMGAYFIMWAIFSGAMLYGVLKTNRALQVVFATLTLLFFMLAITQFTHDATIGGSVTIGNVTGVEGVICGLSAVYLGIAEVLNEVHNRTVLPIYPLT